MGYQSTTILGNLGKDPEQKYTAAGMCVCTFSVAVNTKYGEKEDVEWFAVVAWDKLAEVCGQYLAKGREVLVQGEMKTRNWQGQDGQKHYRTELVARTVQFVGGNKQEGAGPESPFDD